MDNFCTEYRGRVGTHTCLVSNLLSNVYVCIREVRNSNGQWLLLISFGAAHFFSIFCAYLSSWIHLLAGLLESLAIVQEFNWETDPSWCRNDYSQFVHSADRLAASLPGNHGSATKTFGKLLLFTVVCWVADWWRESRHSTEYLAHSGAATARTNY